MKLYISLSTPACVLALINSNDKLKLAFPQNHLSFVNRPTLIVSGNSTPSSPLPSCQRSGNPFVNHSSDEELESDSSSDESSKENKSLHKNAASTSKVSSTKRSSHVTNKKVNKPSELNLSAASKFIIQIMNLDMTESLKWVSECLTEAAEDQMQDIDLDDNEGIPLVAISESDVVAMDHSIFNKFLLSIGIQKPASEQEMYWRIPGNMRATELLKIANVINETIEKGPTPAALDSESSDEDVFDRLRKIIAKPTETITDSTQNTSENNINSSQETSTKMKEKQKKKRVLEDSDSENEIRSEIESSQQSNKENNSQRSNIQSSQGTNVQSSQESNRNSNSHYSGSQMSHKTNSDDENSAKNEHIPTSSKKKESRISRIVDSDASDTDSNSASKRTRHSDSETETNQNSKKMKLTRILDDSDEPGVEYDGNTSERTRDPGSDSEQNVKRKRVAVIDSDDE